MKHLGHPIFGDTSYGGNQLIKGARFSKYKTFVENCLQLMSRQALHAQSLGFTHPVTNQPMHFEQPLPEDFQAVLKRWENYVRYH